MNEKKPMKVEVQMRTIAMDFWASIEHKLYYKKQTDGFPDSVSEDLGICAEQLHTIDMKMQEISERIYHQER
jgi:putative GTP pyrophosphokinase